MSETTPHTAPVESHDEASADVMQQLRQRAADLADWRPAAAETVQRDEVAVFTLGNETWGIALRWVREVIAPIAVTAIPGAPSFVRGVFLHRGSVLSMVDLQKFLEIPGTQQVASSVLILSNGDMEFGLEVCAMQGYRSIVVGDLSPHLGLVSGGAKGLAAPLLGVTTDRVAVLDGARLLAMPELVVDQSN